MNRTLNPPMLVAALLFLLAGAASLGWLWLRDGRVAPMGIVWALLPFGLLLADVPMSGGERSQTGITAWAIAMFGALVPAIYVMQSGPANWFEQWRFMAAFGGAYAVILLAFLAWLAGWTAWVPPAPGAAPLPEQRLRQRIGSLADAGLALRVEQPPSQPGQLLVTRDFRDAERTIAVRLHFDAASHCVRARELSRVRGDRPMNAGEARMSSSLRPRDGTHPDADLIHDASLTVTLPSAAMRHQIGARVTDDRVTIAGDREAATDPANLSHVLAEIVHQSGWGWQGVFFNWQHGCR